MSEVQPYVQLTVSDHPLSIVSNIAAGNIGGPASARPACKRLRGPTVSRGRSWNCCVPRPAAPTCAKRSRHSHWRDGGFGQRYRVRLAEESAKYRARLVAVFPD